MATVEQLTFGDGRLSWSYLDDLPRWRHLKRHRPDVEGQLSLL